MSKIEKTLEEARKVFLADDLDDDEREHNLAEIQKWEQDIIEATEYENWRTHEITRRLAKEARDIYKDMTMQLGLRRGLTPEQIMSFQAKQDACVVILSMVDKDVQSTLESLQNTIRESIRTAGWFHIKSPDW